MHAYSAAAMLLPLVAVTACATATSTHYRQQTEDLERVAAPIPADAGDHLFEGAAFLDRAELIRHVLERNPNVRASRDAWRAALARYPQVTALDDPMFSYDLRPRSIGSDEVDTANDFGVSQAIPFPGKLGLRGKTALAEAESAQSDVAMERVQLAALASRLFDEYWLAERALEITAQHAALLEDAHRASLSRYSTGTGTQQDVLAAETEQGMLAHEERELAAQRQIVTERINTLLHRNPELPLPSPPRELDSNAAAHELDAPTLIGRAIEGRPELRGLAAMVRAREAEVSLARREFLPDFRVRGGYETSWQENPLKPVVGVELNVPLQLGRRRAALEEASARLAREHSRLHALEDRIRFEVTSAVERLRESQHLLEISQQRRLPPARDRVVGARAAFASGQITFLEFVDAQRSLLAAEQAEFEVRAAVSVRRAALARALGEVATMEGVQP
jgi:cobalt-zinc-cadmium efflux system outer membrane protein